jgi:RNA polymerase sigma-70 factor (ECF subfamily)
MNENEWLAEQFEEHRSRLRAVSYRMLGSEAEADDALQDAWVRVSRADASAVENVGGWLTTIVARVCLNRLRSRNARREELSGAHVPDPIISLERGRDDPEHEAVLADSVGLALLVVLETLAPAERLAFVLHDMFDLPFDEIAPMVGRSAAAARQLASRARRRVRGAAPVPDADLAGQRKVVDAFFAAARDGDFAALVAVLDPDVVLRSDGGDLPGRASAVVHGPSSVAERAMMFARPEAVLRPVLVNGAAGVVAIVDGRPISVMGFTVANGTIVEIDALTDPERLSRLDLTVLDQ